MGQLRFDANPGRSVATRNPTVPDGVHGDGIVDISQVNGYHEQPRLVAAGLLEELLDSGEDFACLRGDIGVKRLRRLDEIDRVAIRTNVGIPLCRAVPLYRCLLYTSRCV